MSALHMTPGSYWAGGSSWTLSVGGKTESRNFQKSPEETNCRNVWEACLPSLPAWFLGVGQREADNTSQRRGTWSRAARRG